jgi:hypothetical protein
MRLYDFTSELVNLPQINVGISILSDVFYNIFELCVCKVTSLQLLALGLDQILILLKDQFSH